MRLLLGQGGGRSAGMWGDQNDVMPKACSIWLDSDMKIPSNPINAFCIERNWCIICEQHPVCHRGDIKEGRQVVFSSHHIQSLLTHFFELGRLGLHKQDLNGTFPRRDLFPSATSINLNERKYYTNSNNCHLSTQISSCVRRSSHT